MTGGASFSRRALLGGAGVVLGGAALRGRSFAAPAGVTLSAALPDPIGKGALIFDVRPAGYVAEEYFLSGFADVYEPVTMADAHAMAGRDNVADLGRRSFERTVLRRAAPYTTRIVIYRPQDPSRFSGNVIIEANHPVGGGHLSVWQPFNDIFISNGDVHLSVQHPITFVSLKGALPDRYAPLQAADTTQIWGMLRDAGALARSAGPENPLRALGVRRLYMTGYSYTGVATATFANFHHDQARLPDGRPIFDGYVPMANATYVRDLDVPVLRINTQSDFDSFGGLNNRKADSDARIGRYRLYEVPGAAHVRTEEHWPGLIAPPPPLNPFVPPPGVPQAGGGSTCQASFPAGSHANDFPLHHYVAAAFSNLYAWVDYGAPPPPGGLIATDASGATLTDRLGNALGGLRSTEIEVAVARYGVGKGACMLLGFTLALTSQELNGLYGSPAAYAERARARTRELVGQRLLRPREAELVYAEIAKNAARFA